MSEQLLTVKIDGKTLTCQPGQSIIEVADQNGIFIPRFCYHKSLSVVASCRMCLVEVERAPKALPACATPVSDGMVVKSQSKIARQAQKAVMEFLLINHPLDCPICDQGGECELQDVSMGYGQSNSEFYQSKRAVKDEDLGPLIATHMTRCIHCTRCVRFGREIAGMPELGATHRGGHMEIGTFLKQGVQSEVSGNMIDLCPVGALTSKPFKYQGRSWGFQSHSHVAAHDCLGSNIFVHTQVTNIGKETRLMRVLPKENNLINGSWISDRDRFSYHGNAQHRITQPMIKQKGEWTEVSWQEALTIAAKKLSGIKSGKGQLLMSPSVSSEEGYMAFELARHLGFESGFSLLRKDLQDQHSGIGVSHISMSDIQNAKNIMLLGSNPKVHQPILGVAVRHAQQNGASIQHMSASTQALNYDADQFFVHPNQWIAHLLSHAQSQNLTLESPSKATDLKVSWGQPDVWILGEGVLMHTQGSEIRSIVSQIAKQTGAKVLILTEGSNTAGLSVVAKETGVNLSDQMAQDRLKADNDAVWLHQVHPEYDLPFYEAMYQNLKQTFVLATSSYWTDQMKEYADLVLPIASHFETSGTQVNVMGQTQSYQAAIMPLGESRPAWKVIKVMGQLLDQAGFSDIDDLGDIQQKMKLSVLAHEGYHYVATQPSEVVDMALTNISAKHPMACDSQVRNTEPLQLTMGELQARISEETLESLGIHSRETVVLTAGASTEVKLNVCDSIAKGCIELTGNYRQLTGSWLQEIELGNGS
jgi:NADH-quinone oxidoreductase subunit G